MNFRRESSARLSRLGWGALSLASLVLVGCNTEPQPEARRKRSDAVLQTGPAASQAPSALAQPDPAQADSARLAPAKQKDTPLCSAGALAELPESQVSGLGASSTPFAGGRVGGRGPTWVNVWAAWCEPCKKELPLIKSFAARLKKDGHPIELAFLSLDDDERQLQRFLDQPGGSVFQTYWLVEGKERDEWLADAELPSDPRLPVQLLTDAGGNVICRIDGSIEESDYAAILKVFSGG